MMEWVKDEDIGNDICDTDFVELKILESKKMVADIAVEMMHESIEAKRDEIDILYKGIKVVRDWKHDNTRGIEEILDMVKISMQKRAI